MANKIPTVRTYLLNGAVDFTITFEYLARKFVRVTLIGKDRKELVLNQDYRFTGKTQITTSRAWTAADGYQMIEIRRFTSASDRLVDFADGSILRAYDLNISQIQTLHVAEEARDLTADTIGVNNDGNLDARGRRIVNVANPVDDFDALNLRTVKEWDNSAYQSYIKAQEEANSSRDEADRSKREADRATQQANASAGSAAAAKTSETNAKTSETNSKASENAAWDSRQKAATSETNAKSSENAAFDSRTKAEAARDRAILEADKLENNNLFAGTIESIVEETSEVRMKGPFNAKSFGSSGDIVSRWSWDPSFPVDAYINTPAFRAGWRTRGNMPGVTDYGRVSFYGQEHVGNSFSAIIDVVGYGTHQAWHFRQGGDFTSPRHVMAGQNLYAGMGNTMLESNGNLSGGLWAQWGNLWSGLNNKSLFAKPPGGVQLFTFRGGDYLEGTVDGTAVGFRWFQSDRRLKEDIKVVRSADDMLNIIRSYIPVSYKYKDASYTDNRGRTNTIEGKRSRAGFITQDLIRIWPEAVDVMSDGMQSPDPNQIIGGLMLLVKNLDARIQELEKDKS